MKNSEIAAVLFREPICPEALLRGPLKRAKKPLPGADIFVADGCVSFELTELHLMLLVNGQSRIAVPLSNVKLLMTRVHLESLTFKTEV